jgi:small subunit ribosomal protein S2
MLTNFHTIRKAVKKMAAIDGMFADGTFDNMSKREKLTIKRQRGKLERNLGSIADLTRLPAAVFIVDIHNEDIAVAEARRLKITTYAMVDTNSDPTLVDFAIPSNDDSSKSIELIVSHITAAIAEGLEERKKDKEAEAAITQKKKADKKESEEADETVTASEEETDKDQVAADSDKTEEKEKKQPKDTKSKTPSKKAPSKDTKTTKGKRKRISAATSA